MEIEFSTQTESPHMAHVKIYTGAHCPYCNMAKHFLKQLGITEIEKIRTDLQPHAFAEMQQITGQRTIPQIFIGNTHIGGFTDMYALHQKGGLQELLNQE